MGIRPIDIRVTLPTLLVGVSAAAFLFYGVLGLTSQSVKDDFERFDLPNLRRLTGILEVLGSLSLLVGLRWPPALWIGSAGLALLMLIAFSIRIRMKDSLAQSIPSFSLMCLNLYILFRSIRHS